MQVRAEGNCAVDPPFHRALQRAALQAVLVARRERRSKARNASRAQNPPLLRRGLCTTTYEPASKEKTLRAVRLAVFHFSSLSRSAPIFHSSLLVITIVAQIADGRNSTLHTTMGHSMPLHHDFLRTRQPHVTRRPTQPTQHNSTTTTNTTYALTCYNDLATRLSCILAPMSASRRLRARQLDHFDHLP
jgi:hypothetical protein